MNSVTPATFSDVFEVPQRFDVTYVGVGVWLLCFTTMFIRQATSISR